MPVTVQRSPFLTQSFAATRRRRLFWRVMIMSPTLAWLPSARSTSPAGVVPARRWVRARWLSSATQFAGGGEHDRVQAAVAVGAPGVEQVVGHGGFVADVDAVLVEVEPERLGVAVAQGEGGGAFGGVGEPDAVR